MIVNLRPRTLRRRLALTVTLTLLALCLVVAGRDEALTDHLHTGVTPERCWIDIPFGHMGGTLQ